MKLRLALIALAVGSLMASAETSEKPSTDASSLTVADILPKTSKPAFSWGVDAGSAIDMTGHDMSAIDLNAYFGYRGPYVRFAGAGTGIDITVSKSSTTYPLYAIFRTDFSPTPRLCFLELRGGVAFTKVETAPSQNTPFASVGVGVTLAKGQTFSSHLILSYNYTKLNDYTNPEGVTIPIHDMQAACIRIGINF
ncbi:MAG: hypothetical protein HDS75_05430 [Bacteroidales bacterium]|nr:hypothetical protein [Bacteroidales bacterium]